MTTAKSAPENKQKNEKKNEKKRQPANRRERLWGVLAAEQRQGYLDSSVLGGFGLWLTELGIEWGRPELERLGETYAEAALRERPELWQQARDQLLGAAQTVAGEAAGDSVKSGSKVSEQASDSEKNSGGEHIANRRRASADLLETSIEYVKGVGPKRAALLRRLELYKVADLLYDRPRDYESRPAPVTIGQLAAGEVCTVCGQVLSRTVLRPKRGLAILKAVITDGTGEVVAVWYNQQHLESQLTVGRKLVVFGKTEWRYGEIQLAVQDFEFGEAPGDCELLPLYNLTANLNQKSMRKLVGAAWGKFSQYIQESLPEELLERRGLLPLRRALYQLHFPKTAAEAEQGRERLAYEELLVTQLTVLASRTLPESKGEGLPRDLKTDTLERFAEGLAFSLTGAQRRVIGEIYRDMEGAEPMRRLVQGDVGCGKTAVAAAALYKNWRAGLQGALMAPTELLAEQHMRSLQGLLGDRLGLRLGLLTGDTRAGERRELLGRLAAGEVDVLIGTHALFSGDVEFARLGLAVTDEQHRFGVNQRSALRQKGRQADVLVLTATPIPRTLAMTFCGDLAVSAIDELPPGRQPIITYAVANDLEERALHFVLGELEKGRQAYVVCPLVEENEEQEQPLVSAAAYAERLQQNFANWRVGLLHGKMKPQDKEAVMRDFLAGEVQVLVATTVIEVGVDVPNATIMLVRDAERFGLAQLHQLRGRVGRGGGQSYCLLLNNARTREARERLKTLVESCDGFVIAEADLRLRGAGELLGTRQSGLAALKFAELGRDLRLIEQSRQDAMELLASGEYLEWPIAKEVRRKARLLES